MSSVINDLHQLIESPQACTEDFANFSLPDSMLALIIDRQEQNMFGDLPKEERDPRLSLHVREVPTPELAESEVIVAVMASSINYNTVWSAIFEPLPTFQFLSAMAKRLPGAQKHNLNHHILGSDAAGVVVKVGKSVTKWKPGDRITVHPAVTSMALPQGHNDSIKDPDIRAWGYETNFGGLAEFCLVNESQLMPKPEHLSWEESASLALVSGTAYRMLVSDNGARMKQGDNVLIWGGAGGMGSLGIQYVLRGGGRPVAVVSGEEKVQLAKALGCELVIDRRKEGYQFLNEDGSVNERHLVKFRARIERLLGGESIDIVYEHTGKETFPASVFVAKRGGKVVTCGSTTGYEHVFDNRYLWMNVKSIIGSHGANYAEAFEANRLACLGQISPTLSDVYTLKETPRAVAKVHANQHVGKVGVLCMAQRPGLGIRNWTLREKVGEHHINAFRQNRSKDAR